MTPPPRLAASYRLLVVAILGFASGLPLALTGQALQAWLSVEGLDIATIGFLSLVGLPYTFKFLWAPLMDRFELWPALGRRRCGSCPSRRRRARCSCSRCWRC
jgi:PAT family beta-lactamase induction signal transducer AmpG